MKIKRCLASVTAAAFCAAMITGTASAHNEDIWGGRYIDQLYANVILRLDSSAITSLLNYNDVYSHGTDWNGIRDNVNVTVINYAPGMPTVAGQMLVMGKKLDPNVLGQTIPYGSDGNILYDGSMNYRVNGDWKFVRITLNTDTAAYNSINNKTSAARTTFVHEVGHALKLSHPKQGWLFGQIEGHNINGFPFAVMNQGYPSSEYPEVSETITQHDIDCINNKWITKEELEDQRS